MIIMGCWIRFSGRLWPVSLTPANMSPWWVSGLAPVRKCVVLLHFTLLLDEQLLSGEPEPQTSTSNSLSSSSLQDWSQRVAALWRHSLYGPVALRGSWKSVNDALQPANVSLFKNLNVFHRASTKGAFSLFKWAVSSERPPPGPHCVRSLILQTSAILNQCLSFISFKCLSEHFLVSTDSLFLLQ